MGHQLSKCKATAWFLFWTQGFINGFIEMTSCGGDFMFLFSSLMATPIPSGHRLGIRALRGPSPQFQPVSCPHNIMRLNLAWHTRPIFPKVLPEKQVLINSTVSQLRGEAGPRQVEGAKVGLGQVYVPRETAELLYLKAKSEQRAPCWISRVTNNENRISIQRHNN